MPPLDQLTDHPRVTVRRPGPPDPGGRAVVYWMQRAQRASDNPALDTAIEAGNRLGRPVVAFFGLVPSYPRANLRHYQFMVEALPEVAEGLERRNVGFVIRRDGEHGLERFCEEVGAALLVGDENPLRETEEWRRRVSRALRVPFWTVDADLVVPSRLLEKEQYAARTIRPRIHRQLEWSLVASRDTKARVRWVRPRGLRTFPPGPALLDSFPIDRRVQPVATFESGPRAGQRRLRRFVRTALNGYAKNRNHPELPGTSQLSPYLHFGHLGPREVALAVRDADAPLEDRQAFLEEFIVRRELAVNFVRFNPRYDTLDGCEPWARRTLGRHRADPRPWRYTERQLEHAETHDPLWNAAQRQMVASGWMHGYVRMYWAKKILGWTQSPEEAMAIAVCLNDRYELDGRDPSGYAGIAWAIGGKHDRAWGPERPIYGTVRYMSYASTSRKFDAKGYIDQMNRLVTGTQGRFLNSEEPGTA
jgi:deoxyribodipyrimidine photo-lyase